MGAKGVGYVDSLWYAHAAAVALDSLPSVDAIRSDARWAQGAYFSAGSLRFSVVYDYRDRVVYVEVAGLSDPADALRALPQVVGVSARSSESGTWLSGEPVLSIRVGPESLPLERDLMVQVARTLSALAGFAGSVPVGDSSWAGFRQGRDGTVALARAAGRAFRPWRVVPIIPTLRVPTPHGRLIVHASLGTGVPWLARIVTAEPPPANEARGVRWTPSLTGTRCESIAITWPEPATATSGRKVPALREVLATLRA